MPGELILILTPDEPVKQDLSHWLNQAGYQTLLASESQTALGLLQTHSPVLLISEIEMPGHSGLEFWQQARQVLPALAGIFMSDHTSVELATGLFQAGVSGFLLKPFDRQKLLANVKEVLETKSPVEPNLRQPDLTSFIQLQRWLADENWSALLERLASITHSDYCALFITEDDSPDPVGVKLVYSFSSPTAQAFSPRIFPALRMAARTLELGRPLNLRRTATVTVDVTPEGEAVPGVVAGLPVRRGGRATGVLLAGRAQPEPPYSAIDHEIFDWLAGQLGLMAENRRLTLALERYTERLRQFAGNFISGQEVEKQALNDRINKGLLPILISTRKNIQAFLQKARPSSAGDLLQAEERLHGLINSVKKLTHVLRPANLDEFGLSAALRQYVREFSEETPGCKITFQLEGEEVPRLENQIELALFRACQEALDNACQRAGSNPVNLTVRVIGPRNKPKLVELEVKDNAPGLDLLSLEAAHPQLWLNLLAIQERVQLAGGAYRYETDGTGTRIIISHDLPVLEAST